MPPSFEASYSIADLIRKCYSINSLRPVRQLHPLIVTAGCSHSPYANNNLISMYARCGSVWEAHKVFDNMPQRNTVSYNALISVYARNPNHANFALKLITRMESESLRPSGSTFTSLVQASAVLEDCLMGSSLHTQVLKLGFFDDLCVQTSVLGMYSSCGDLKSARQIFECMNVKDAVAWNSLTLGSFKNDEIEGGFKLFKRMMNSSVAPTKFTYSMVLNACSKLGDCLCGALIHARMIVLDILFDLPLQNALLDMYCSCGDLEAAFVVFGGIEKPNLVSWNSIISGCSQNGYGEKAIDFFSQLRAISDPKPDEYTFAAIVSATGELPALAYGRPLHGQVLKTGFERSVFIGTTLVSMYSKNGEKDSAQKIFDLIPERDPVLWTEIIMVQSRFGSGENSVQLFIEMYRERNKTDGFALSGVLGVCADLAMLKQGEMFHSLVLKTGHDTEMSVCGSLIDMYGKNGDLSAAESNFSNVLNPDLKCWNSMLGAYSHYGMAEEASNIFNEILKTGLKPDQVTYLSLISACSHKGLTQKGKFLWNHMKENGFIPGPKHYSCMVSLLTRTGLLDEAMKLIKESALNEGCLELWRTLLSACVNIRNLEIGLRAAERALKLDSEDTATHVLVSNLYAVTGKWEGVARFRRKIRGLSSVKDPGLSWIEVKNRVQIFGSGDQSNPEVDEAEDELHRLKCNMIRLSTDEHDLAM